MAFVHELFCISSCRWGHSILSPTGTHTCVFRSSESQGAALCGAGRALPLLPLNLVLLLSRLFDRIRERPRQLFPRIFFFFCVSPKLKETVLKCCQSPKQKWHVTRTQSLDMPAKEVAPSAAGDFSSAGCLPPQVKGAGSWCWAVGMAWSPWPARSRHSAPLASLCTRVGYSSLIRFPIPHHFPMV